MAKTTCDPVKTIDDLARYLKLSTSTLDQLRVEGRVPGQKVGRHWWFRGETIRRWFGKSAPPRYSKWRGHADT